MEQSNKKETSNCYLFTKVSSIKPIKGEKYETNLEMNEESFCEVKRPFTRERV